MKQENSSGIAYLTVEDNDSSNSNDEEIEVSHFSGSSNEFLCGIRLNDEFVKKEEISDFDLRTLVVLCSACGRRINHRSKKEVKRHRKLKVITCKECYEFYGKNEFSQDECGLSNYCTWCGHGGELIVCDYCPNRFCSACIQRNFGSLETSETPKVGWKCCICSENLLNTKIKFCDLIISFIHKSALKKKSRHQPFKRAVSETWLLSALDKSDEACKVFCKKLAELKTIEIGRKSLKHFVKKMEGLIKDLKICLKKIVESTNEAYARHIEHEKQLNKKISEIVDSSTENGGLFNSAMHEVKEINSKNLNGENNVDDIMEEEKSKAERLQAKLKLLQSSSDSENGSETTTPTQDTDLKTNGKSGSSDDNDEINEMGDILDKRDNGKKSSSDKAEHKTDSSSDTSSKDFENDVDKQVESSNDPKLNQIPNVELMRCDYLLKDSETTPMIIKDSDAEDELDKLVDRLCTFSKNIYAPRVQKAKRRSGPFKSKASAKQQLLQSSSSMDSLSSEEDEDQKKIQLGKRLPLKVKRTDSDDSNSSSSIALNSDSDDDERKKKKPKDKKKVESEFPEDFVPVKKVRKYDPLLHGPLLSDDTDNSEKGKKEKTASRKRKIFPSDENKKSSKSLSTSSSDETDKEKNPQKRRFLKKQKCSSDEDKDKGDTPSKGRKNIRMILSNEEIAMTTKEAQAEEKERKQRIAERQDLFNKIEETVHEGKEVIIRKMVLEVDPDSKEVIEIHPNLVCKLKTHQVEGVKFMWDCTIESVKNMNKPGSGCILAHCMGLGKTLQVITLLHTCLTSKIVGQVMKRAMIICPYNMSLNWGMEFDYWLDGIGGDIKVHQLAMAKSNLERLDILKYWFAEGGVIIISYGMFRRLTAKKVPKLKKQDKGKVSECLLDPGPDIVVCDEGHLLKNEKSAISLATNKLVTRRRIVLTGTPLQNNLKEYHCMVSFVKPNLLGTTKEFFNRFVNPITNGQYEDSSAYDVKLMKRRIHILHKLLDGCVQRCDYSALSKFLPPKHEFVISVKLSETQAKMYECYLEKLSTAKQESKIHGRTLFADFSNLRNIWTHPYICHTAHKRIERRKSLKDEGFSNDGEVTEPESSSEEVILMSDSNNDENSARYGNKKYKTRSRTKEGYDNNKEDETDVEPGQKQWYHEFMTEADKNNIELSGKMVMLLEILKECEQIGDKVLLFSQSLLTLDMIESILSYSETQSFSQKTEGNGDTIVSWCIGFDYFRIDGTTSIDFRKSYIDMFNNPSNKRARLFLISTRAGSLGTNLVGANRVILFDTSWNPSHDMQAIFRVYRFGQLKPVYIYRLLAQGTMEEKIYDRQVTKISLAYRVMDEQQIERHFSAADLAELYSFDRNSTKQRPTPMVPKDRLLAELLIRHKEWIVTYHEHDSLLQNETEMDLTEEERQAAWTEYENEKEERKTPSISETNPIVNYFDASTLMNEPDFSQDYEGRKIPDLKTIVECLFAHLTKSGGPDLQKNPLEFKKRLLASMYTVRQTFHNKLVKVLYMKQEYCSRGSVPTAINKYVDELSQVLKSTGNYITRLSGDITSEQTQLKKMQKRSQQVFQQQQPQIAYPSQNGFRGSVPRTIRRTRPYIFPTTSTSMNTSQMKAKQQRINFPSSSNKSTNPVITADSVPRNSNK